MWYGKNCLVEHRCKFSKFYYSNLSPLSWLEHIWKNKSWNNLLHGQFTWTMWNHRNVIFKNDIRNPISIIEHAMKRYHYTTLYDQKTNKFSKTIVHALISTLAKEGKGIIDGLLPPHWYEMEYRCFENRSANISYVCKESRGKTLHLSGKSIGDCLVRIAEILAIHEAIKPLDEPK